MTIKTRENDERFLPQVPDFKLEKRERRPRYRTWRDDPDLETKQEPVAVESPTERPVETPIEMPTAVGAGKTPIEMPIETPTEIPTKVNRKANRKANQPQPEYQPLASPALEQKNKPQPKPQPKGQPKPQSEYQPEPQPKGQSEYQPTESKRHLAVLEGIQKQLLYFYYERCQINGGEDTGMITLSRLTELTSRDGDTLKTANQRLIAKGLLYRKSFTTGRGGYVVYSIPAFVTLELSKWKPQPKPQSEYQPKGQPEYQSEPQSKGQPEGQPPSSCSSSSSSYPISEGVLNTPSNTTTTATGDSGIEAFRQQVQKENEIVALLSWPGETRRFISNDNIRELIRKGQAIDWLQTAIDIFAACIDDPSHTIRNPAGLFMSKAREGMFLNPPSGYIHGEALRQVARSQQNALEEAIESKKQSIENESKYAPIDDSLDTIPF